MKITSTNGQRITFTEPHMKLTGLRTQRKPTTWRSRNTWALYLDSSQMASMADHLVPSLESHWLTQSLTTLINISVRQGLTLLKMHISMILNQLLVISMENNKFKQCILVHRYSLINQPLTTNSEMKDNFKHPNTLIPPTYRDTDKFL